MKIKEDVNTFVSTLRALIIVSVYLVTSYPVVEKFAQVYCCYIQCHISIEIVYQRGIDY